MSKKKFTGDISGKGYYIALVLCAVAIGVTGFLYYRNAAEPQQDPSSGLSGNDVAAVATQPAEVPTEATDPVVVDPQKPEKRVNPVSRCASRLR